MRKPSDRFTYAMRQANDAGRRADVRGRDADYRDFFAWNGIATDVIEDVARDIGVRHRARIARRRLFARFFAALAVVAVAALAWLLAGCSVVTVNNIAPAAPATCPSLELKRITRTVERGEVVELRVRWPGPGAVRVRITDMALVDSNDRIYLGGGAGEALVLAGKTEPAELTARPLDDAWLTEARLDYPGCPPAVVALPEPR